MKTLLPFVAVCCFSSPVLAWTDDPFISFDSKGNSHQSMTINWIPVDNVQKACEDESKKRGKGGFGFAVNACSFWEGNSCTVITRRYVNLQTLGHEVRHCFQGNWH